MLEVGILTRRLVQLAERHTSCSTQGIGRSEIAVAPRLGLVGESCCVVVWTKRSEGLTIGAALSSGEVIDVAVVTIERQSKRKAQAKTCLQVQQSATFAHIRIMLGVRTLGHQRANLVGDDIVRSDTRQTQVRGLPLRGET